MTSSPEQELVAINAIRIIGATAAGLRHRALDAGRGAEQDIALVIVQLIHQRL